MTANPYDSLEQTNPSLLRSVRDRGNQEAWSQFDALYRPMLRRFAKSYGLKEADLDDVVQHCMTALCVKMDEFTYDPSRGRFKGWLRTMVNNRCRDLLRMRGNLPVELEAAERVTAEGSSPEEAFEQIWMDEHLSHCVRLIEQEVDATTYSAFRKYVIESKEVEDVCRELALTPNQLYKIKHKLTKRLKELMSVWVGEEAEVKSKT